MPHARRSCWLQITLLHTDQIYRVPSDNSAVPEISICNVHDGSASFGQPEQRPQDGLWQNTFRRLLSDPYFSVIAAWQGVQPI
jgi:hypothetical protein